jgi:hypothetical protein
LRRRLRTGLIRIQLLHKLCIDVDKLKSQSTQQRRRITNLEADNTSIRGQLDHVMDILKT